MKRIMVLDIEADGLLPHQVSPQDSHTLTKAHCMYVHDLTSGEYHGFKNTVESGDTFPEGLSLLNTADILVLHNGIQYDLPALEFLYGFTPKGEVIDTLVLSRLIFPHMIELDSASKKGNLPSRLYGSHSLESWGYRMGTLKDEYQGDTRIADYEERKANKWAAWNPDMDAYCKIDVQVTTELFKRLLREEHYFPGGSGSPVYAVNLEHWAARVLSKMTRNGFPFGESEGGSLYAELAGKRAGLLTSLVETFGTWYQAKGGTSPLKHPVSGKPITKYPLVRYPKAGDLLTKSGSLSKTPYYKDRPYTPIQLVQFNPNSRDHIAKVLKDSGWIPEDFTETGKPIVDEERLKLVKVADPDKQKCVDLIAEYLLISKRIGQVSEGGNAWLKLVHPSGLIHGSINPNGAVSGRATHSTPNITQVPSGTAPYGPQCRSLFGAKHWEHIWPDATQVGTDASGLELRCLGHYLHLYDGGAYSNAVLHGDVHWETVKALGLVSGDTLRDKHNPQHDAYRSIAKTFKTMGVYKLL